MKTKLLPILLILLILLNGFLIFMVVKKPHNNRKNLPPRNFLTEQLDFSKKQTRQFVDLENIHRNFMENLDEEIIKNKDVLFNSFSNITINVDSITNQIGVLEGKKEAEIFRFFSNVRELCTLNQIEKFDNIIKEALKGGKRKPPRENKGPSHGNKHLPPQR